MAFWSTLPVESDEHGNLIPIEVMRKRHEEHMRECYPMLYPAEADDRGARPVQRGGFCAGFVTGAVSALGIAGLVALWFR